MPISVDLTLASQLRALARKTRDRPPPRRLLALTIYEGASRTAAA
jgi:hypothetical protein